MLAWPHRDSDWHTLLPEIEQDFLALTRAVTACEYLILIVRDADHRRHVQELCRNHCLPLARICMIEAATDDTWCRDFGPVAVREDGRLRLIDFRFNAWGGRYPCASDDRLNGCLDGVGVFRAPLHRSEFILEGGSIDTDGAGTLLTTESCLLESRRNRGDRDRLEAELRRQLPVERVIWLKNAWLAGDDTDGHIDNLARFTAPGRIAHLACPDPDDEHYDPLQALRAELQALRREDGRPYELVELPLPAPCYSRFDGRRLPASYANFLVINGAVLLPQFSDPADAVARERLQGCFPGRRIVGIDSRLFIEQNGGIHCLTMQLPEGAVNLELFKP